MQESRKDVLTAQKIDIGLIFQRMLGDDDARQYLASEKIPAPVVERVLSEGEGRRHAAAQEASAADAMPDPRASAAPAVDGTAPMQLLPLLSPPNVFYGGTGRRRDVVRAAVVQAALAVRDVYDQERAERLLRREEVPDAVISRVMADEAGQRRCR